MATIILKTDMRCGLIGEKLSHSYSKQIHELLGFYGYDLLPTEKEDLEALIKSGKYDGFNVTIPYKQNVIPYLDEISERAGRIGAVNTVYFKGGRICGDNTDFTGLKSTLIKKGFDLSQKTVLILGGGGTSKTAYAVCEDLGASTIYKVSRTPSDNAISYGEAKQINADYIINTTPVGMYPDTDKAPITLESFKELKGVCDVIFNPYRTRLLVDAKERNIPYTSGLYMLVSQAVASASMFCGKEIDTGVVDEIYRKVRANTENIVLIGMPASGKTTVGKLIAKKTGRKFIDTDDEITKITGNIADFINGKGEQAFRDIEEQVVKTVTQNERGAVISTGGGAILRENNRYALSGCGRVYFLDRPPENITPDASRPLSADKEKLFKRYTERYPVYCALCDEKIDCRAENFSGKAADKIIELQDRL